MGERTDSKASGRHVDLILRAMELASDSIAIVELTDDDEVPARTRYANESFLRVTGFTLEELLDPSNPLLAVQSDRRLFGDLFRDIRAGKEVSFEAELERRDGTRHWTDVRCTPLADETGAYVYYVCVCRDATERRAAAAKRDLLYRAIEQIADFVVLYDATPPSQGGPYVTYANGAFCHALGYEADELIGMSYRQLLSTDNDPRMLEHLATSVEARNVTEKEVRMRRRDGSTFWVEFTAQPVDPVDGMSDHWVVVARDISARRHAVEDRALVTRALDVLPFGVAIYSVDGRGASMVFQNEAAARAPQFDEGGVVSIPLVDRTGELDAVVVTTSGARRT